MKKSEKDKTFKELKLFFDKWKKRLFLQDWHFHVQQMPTDGGREGMLLSIDPDPVYLQARIFVYPHFYVAAAEGYDIESVVVHELLHCIQSETFFLMEDLAKHKVVTQEQRVAAIERMTQRLTRALLESP